MNKIISRQSSNTQRKESRGHLLVIGVKNKKHRKKKTFQAVYASCSWCNATVFTAEKYSAESEIAGIDQETGLLICKDCAFLLFGENELSA